MSISAHPSSSTPWLLARTFFVEVVLKRSSRSVMKEKNTLEYGGGDSGIEIMNSEFVYSHHVVAREPDCVCQGLIKRTDIVLNGNVFRSVD